MFPTVFIKNRVSILMPPELKADIEQGLRASWSPEQICGLYRL